jgi:hypothetical protein
VQPAVLIPLFCSDRVTSQPAGVRRPERLSILGVAERMRPAQLGVGDRMLRPPAGYPMDTTASTRPRLGPFLWPLVSPEFADCQVPPNRATAGIAR